MSKHQGGQIGPIIAIILILTLLVIGAIYYLDNGQGTKSSGPALSVSHSYTT